MLCSEALSRFIKSKIVEGVSKDTIRHYNTHINFFIKFYGDNDIVNITFDTYSNYILYLKNKFKESSGFKGKNVKLSSRTIKTYASAFKTFIHYCYTNHFIQYDISADIKMPRYRKKVIEILSNDDIKKLISKYDIKNFTNCRDLLIIVLMLECGLRLSEVVRLRLCDFHYDTRLIKILGKGDKERFVPFSYFVSDCLKDYLLHFNIKFKRPVFSDEQLLKNIDGNNCTKNTVALIFRRLRVDFNNIHPHLLRHTFATYFIYNGGSPVYLQMILGHTTLHMTEQYLHLANQLNLKKQSQYSPLSNIKKP